MDRVFLEIKWFTYTKPLHLIFQMRKWGKKAKKKMRQKKACKNTVAVVPVIRCVPGYSNYVIVMAV